MDNNVFKAPAVNAPDSNLTQPLTFPKLFATINEVYPVTELPLIIADGGRFPPNNLLILI